MILNKIFIFMVVSVVLLSGFLMTASAMTDHFNDAAGTAGDNTWKDWKTSWDGIKPNLEQISLTPGANQTQLNFGWYSHTAASKPSVKFATKANMSDAKIFSGKQTAHRIIDGIQYYSSKVTVTGLAENTTYYYQYENDGIWSTPVSYRTKNFTSFKLIFVGDPQIGASVGRIPSDGKDPQTAEIAARNDAYNWNATLHTALNAHHDISFILSAGDQINYSNNDATPQQEIEYSGFLSPGVLKSMPIATVIGNHDSLTTNYQNHFNNPNPFTEETSPTAAGNGYYYSYGSALFIFINTNNYNCADHEVLIKKAIAANPNAKWRILAFHQDIYGSGKDHSDSDGIALRTQLTPIIDKYHIDVVLQGHDHSYARTYQLSGDSKPHTLYSGNAANGVVKWSDEKNSAYQQQNECYTVQRDNANKVINPKGTLYITANSATGSKYYELINRMQDYIAARWQEWKPTYSVIEISDTSLTINTFETETGRQIDSAYTIVKSKTKQ
ncbi:MAG TPA: serine/threonine protein phosphatase [Firmicutes bacterium]|nr:serine/threonine protein phosphatase [Bacillota bacterium]